MDQDAGKKEQSRHEGTSFYGDWPYGGLQKPSPIIRPTVTHVPKMFRFHLCHCVCFQFIGTGSSTNRERVGKKTLARSEREAREPIAVYSVSNPLLHQPTVSGESQSSP
ncbi:hypothetical protein M9H77_16225 [Catharanthus roseus]|uniref:Uncharacterized protein n=1 Tax=Catharanthus roseus TaxID=4058 RepID=A0ACC0AZA7_CATRO|nr:hypothetical protein M9H77_16225 [Catharanthus roseus]